MTGQGRLDGAPPAHAELLRLHRDGQLADRFPAAVRLLDGLSDDELASAGRLLARLDPAAVARAHPGVRAVTVAVTGHGTLAALVPALTGQLARHGLLMRPHVTEYDGHVFALGDPESALYAADPDLVVCVLDADLVFGRLPVPWRVEDVAEAAAGRLAELRRLAARYQETGRGTLVFNTVPLPQRYRAQLVDHASRAGLGVRWREFNIGLLRLAEEHPSVAVVDLDPLVAEGHPADDVRLSLYAKAHLSAELLGRYARELGHLARHLAGRTKKCLALDLDDTLWGGVLGEDGPEGLAVSEGYRGEAFTAFQRVVKQLGSQGPLLAAVSKNDPEPVRAMLRDHPGMTLREDDFVRVAASWRPKPEALTELAAALNVGADSFVFVDDSPYERGLVRHSLPGTAVVDIDGEPALHLERLLYDGWFDVLELTAEDRARAARYRAELDRKDFLDTFDSIEDYLRELGVRARLERMRDEDAARVAQLTLRTNQFNLTTRRLQRPEVRAFAADPDALVLTLRSGDRFGENGLVGALFLRRDGDELHIDNFLLSCRVFARGLEQACLAAVLRHARATGARAVLAGYRESPRNAKVADLYPRYGFAPAGDGPWPRTFRHDLAEIVGVPGHLELTADLEADLEGDPR